MAGAGSYVANTNQSVLDGGGCAVQLVIELRDFGIAGHRLQYNKPIRVSRHSAAIGKTPPYADIGRIGTKVSYACLNKPYHFSAAELTQLEDRATHHVTFYAGTDFFAKTPASWMPVMDSIKRINSGGGRDFAATESSDN